MSSNGILLHCRDDWDLFRDNFMYFLPLVKFHRRGIVISHAVCPCVHDYQSRASKNYPIFMKFDTRMYDGHEQKPIENQLDTFNISIDFIQCSILD